MKEPQELVLCPYCGYEPHEMYDGDDDELRYVVCAHCGARGPYCAAPAGGFSARNEWNRVAAMVAWALRQPNLERV